MNEKMYLKGKTSVKQKENMILVEVIDEDLIKTENGEILKLDKRLKKLLVPITKESTLEYLDFKKESEKRELRKNIKKNIYENNLTLKKLKEIFYMSLNE